MAEFTHQSGVRVSVADGKTLGVEFTPVEKPKSSKKNESKDS